MTYYSVERDLGIADGYLGRIARGQRSPGLKVALLLRDHFGVPVDAWKQAPLPEEQATG